MKLPAPLLKNGINNLVDECVFPQLGASLSLFVIREGDSIQVETEGNEYIFDLLIGSVKYEVDEIQFEDERNNVYEESSNCMHLPQHKTINIQAKKYSEILVAYTKNEKDFPVSFYTVEEELVGADKLVGRCERKKRSFQNRAICPNTNLFCGELVVHQGSWACYPPHQHVEPEIYYYRFNNKNGYAFVEDGEVVHRITENEIVGIIDGKNHSQVVAPGFIAFVFWAQKLQNNGKDIDYVMDPRFAYLDT